MHILRTFVVTAVITVLSLSIANAKEYLIGVHLPLSGPFTRSGVGYLEGMTTAVEIFNKVNQGNTVRLVTIDDESSPAKAVAAVERLIAQKSTAIIGGYGSNIIGPASMAANKAGVVYLTAGSTTAGLSKRGFKTFFRPNSSYGYAKGIAGFIGDLKVKSVSIIYSTKDGPTETAQLVRKELASKNIKVVIHPFDASITDFKPIINKIKLQDHSELIFMAGYENDHVAIVRAAKVLKPDIKAIVGPWSTTNTKMSADFPGVMHNVFGTTMLPHPGAYRTAEGKLFSETYKKRYKREADDSLVQLGYVIGQIMFDAIKRTDSKGVLTKEGGLAEELRKTDRDTILGRVSFDENGDNPHFMTRIGQNQNDNIPIVWPKEFATAKPIYPAVPW